MQLVNYAIAHQYNHYIVVHSHSPISGLHIRIHGDGARVPVIAFNGERGIAGHHEVRLVLYYHHVRVDAVIFHGLTLIQAELHGQFPGRTTGFRFHEARPLLLVETAPCVDDTAKLLFRLQFDQHGLGATPQVDALQTVCGGRNFEGVAHVVRPFLFRGKDRENISAIGE